MKTLLNPKLRLKQRSAGNSRRAEGTSLEDNRAGGIAQRKPVQLKTYGLRPSMESGVFQLAPKKKGVGKTYYHNKHYTFNYRAERIKNKRQPDNKRFNRHIDSLIDGLDEDRVGLTKAEGRLKQKKLSKNLRKKARKNSNKFKRNITEKVGELNATQVMIKKHPNGKLLMGYGKGTGFDQVWRVGDKIFVVEAKGPGAKLGMSDRKGKQMSKTWVKLTAEGMVKSNPFIRKLVLKAMKQKKLKRILISSTKAGNAPKNYTVL